ncbi:ribonuclease H-like protein [Leucogyrophana mollusca]|uniref:Ribonuclease H-like protein n=1 Tax=Leucogyrophana mollusca TaxID=85980 RepID=A0ACB8B713_9AGAM|nr:ribonuclease H-like protein [Leucogyrophana mollusca]
MTAVTKEAVLEDEVRVYSDGSGIDGGIGAAAVLIRDGRIERVLKLHLGSIEKYTVYEAELAGLVLAAELIRTEEKRVRSAVIYSDNQAAVQAATNPRPGPRHHIIDSLFEELTRAKKKHGLKKIAIIRIPGHTGIEGNERADVLAKEAARGSSSPIKRLPSSLRTCDMYTKTLPSESRLVSRRRTKDSKEDSRSFSTRSPHRNASILFQLRSDHALLNKHLFRIKGKANKPKSPLCTACTIRLGGNSILLPLFNTLQAQNISKPTTAT